MEGRLEWNSSENCVMDALPYIDSIAPETSKLVDKLIAEEVLERCTNFGQVMGLVDGEE